MKPISRAPVPMSPAGTSVSAPMYLQSSVIKLWQNAMISLSDFPFGSKFETTFTATDRKTCKGVLENLLETEKFKNALVLLSDGNEVHLCMVRSHCWTVPVSFCLPVLCRCHLPTEHGKKWFFQATYQTFQDNNSLAVFILILSITRESRNPLTTAWWNSGSPGFCALCPSV